MTEQKSVFITGASSGIGYHLALEFAKRGYKVFAGARRVERMEPLKEHGIIPIELDVSSSESIHEAKKAIVEVTGGKLDILYNNAGTGAPGAIFDVEQKDVERVFKVNVFAPLELTKVFQKELLLSQGTVAFTSSIVPLMPFPFSICYIASKSAFSYIPKVLSLEVGKLGIKVVDIATGGVESEIWEPAAVETSKDSIFYLEDDDLLNKSSEVSKRTPTAVYAKNTVDGIERAIRRGAPYTKFYGGENTILARILHYFTPFCLYSKFILSVLKLNKPFERIRKNLGL